MSEDDGARAMVAFDKFWEGVGKILRSMPPDRERRLLIEDEYDQWFRTRYAQASGTRAEPDCG